MNLAWVVAPLASAPIGQLAWWVVAENVQVDDVIDVACDDSCVVIVADVAAAGPLLVTAAS